MYNMEARRTEHLINLNVRLNLGPGVGYVTCSSASKKFLWGMRVVGVGSGDTYITSQRN